MKKTIFKLIVLMIMISATTLAQSQFSKELYVSQKGDSLLYRQLNPVSIDADAKYPLILFLHGAGERGDDNEAQMKHGANMFTNPVNQESYPAFVLLPQCPKSSWWAPVDRNNLKGKRSYPYDAPITASLQAVIELVDKFIDNNPVDPNRIYIMGLSMGGMGTFDMVCRYPYIFAAAIPICGGVNTKRLEELETSTKFRIYHGDADPVVPVTFSRSAYVALKGANTDVQYIEFPGIDHNSWTPAFNMPDFMEWLFSQRK